MRSSRERDRVFNNQPNNNQGIFYLPKKSSRKWTTGKQTVTVTDFRNRDRTIRVRIASLRIAIWRARNRYYNFWWVIRGRNLLFKWTWFHPIQVRLTSKISIHLSHLHLQPFIRIYKQLTVSGIPGVFLTQYFSDCSACYTWPWIRPANWNYLHGYKSHWKWLLWSCLSGYTLGSSVSERPQRARAWFFFWGGFFGVGKTMHPSCAG